MAESVVVGVRVRPFNEREKGLNAELCIDMDGPTTTIRNLKCGEGVPTSFTFDESFWSHDGFEDDGTGYNKGAPGSRYADQAYVFETFGARVLNNAWEGFHCCLFAYGQTGSGKSYSMVGYGKNKGIVPISCEEIFRRIDANTNPNKQYEVGVSVVEIYNELVQDLLVAPEDRPKKGLDIRESKLLGIYIDGVQKRLVDSYPAIESTINESTENRTVGSTLMNATSSRAHTVTTIEFKQVEKVPGASDTTKVSMINLVDLAGSEKAGQTGATGDRLKEGAAINKSLSALGNVIEKLAQKSSGKKNVIIPYRDSKLTRLLQNALGGSSKTIMICALSPASSNYEETLSTLRYADRAKRIKNTAVVNENPQERLMRELREENLKLKEFMENVKDTLGEQDAAALNERVKEIKAAEEVLKEQQKSFTERLQESKDHHEKQRNSRRTICRNNVFLGASVDPPRIVNLNEDMLLTGRIKHMFPEGKTLRIGQLGMEPESSDTGNSSEGSDNEDGSPGGAKEDSDSEAAPDIHIAGVDVLGFHASVTNAGGRCVLRCPKGKAADATHVNGVSFAVLLGSKQAQGQPRAETKRASLRASIEHNIFGETGILATAAEAKGANEAAEEDPDKDGVVLEHGDRVAFSQCLFVFVDPSKGMAEMLIMSGQVTYFAARKELAKNQWKSAGLKFMKGMKMQHALGKDLSAKLMRRISSANLGGESEMGRVLSLKASGRRGGGDGGDGDAQTGPAKSDGESDSTEDFDEDAAVELLRAKDQLLAERERELQELRRQLAEKDAQLAEARAGGAPPLGRPLVGAEGAELPRTGAQLLPSLPGMAARRPCDVRTEIAMAFESAIGAIEQVEALFTDRQAARKQAVA
mmetsp:Transcript_20277/g.63543  ORF Transcript_20277/g.63543 Transcript_20277/m.63543 type:complete len:869 (+) Transcript_20277:56-2662(+)